MYPARNARAPYCHLWPVQLYNIFSTLSHKRPEFRKKKGCFNFLYNFETLLTQEELSEILV